MGASGRETPEGDAPSSEMDEPEWVVLRRLHDPIEAEMAVEFLRQHDVPVAMQGSAVAGVLNGYGVVPDLRILVPRDVVDSAERALEAMAAPAEALLDGEDDPSRAGDADEDELPPRAALITASSPLDTYREVPSARAPTNATRRTRAEVVRAAIFVPGGGHFCVGARSAGAFFAMSVIGCVGVALITQAWALALAVPAILAADATLAMQIAQRPSHARSAVRETLAAVLSVATIIAAIGAVTYALYAR